MANYVAVDSCFVINMSKFMSADFYDERVQGALDKNCFNSSHFLNMDYHSLPRIMREPTFRDTYTLDNVKQVYSNLISYHKMKELIISKKVQLILSPIVLNELKPNKNTMNNAFLRSIVNLFACDHKI